MTTGITLGLSQPFCWGLTEPVQSLHSCSKVPEISEIISSVISCLPFSFYFLYILCQSDILCLFFPLFLAQLCTQCYLLTHRWQTQDPRAESTLHLVLSGPAPCFYLAAAPSSLPLVKEQLHLYSPKITFGPLKATARLMWPPMKMSLTPLF